MKTIRILWGWIQIAIGLIGLICAGVIAFMDIQSSSKTGHGPFAAAYSFYILTPISLWILTGGILWLRRKLMGTVMCVVTTAFFSYAVFYFVITPIFFRPSEAVLATLTKEVDNIPFVEAVEQNYLEDTFALHLYYAPDVLVQEAQINEIEQQILKLIKSGYPKIRDYSSSIRMLAHPYQSLPKGGFVLTNFSKDVEYVYNKSTGIFIKK